ncbi:NAD-dependent epimerase/dehydratase family protein [Sphingobium lactosutens]|uniref:NAD-dependent epimerase/dehydratase domain-containing protein n=1 Tax=Sphingobium lactosutens DS20 TaxID=1331060 RepID=T0H975_9SPHN|nr:NAD-dependent epimerase/dehydratase family protein [Sphingobium lactosutens]EQB12841.1 hypothetical protein RLDS_18880 [Sphingobium lactosutens DS20]
MKIVVTGAGGFVGRRLVERLVTRGDIVTGTDTVSGSVPDGALEVAGDIADPQVRGAALAGGCDAIVHLATVPGGAAEADPAASWRINVEAMHDLLQEASLQRPGLRFVYASSIAVYGDSLPAQVDDNTPLSPRLIYGGHKAMMEQALAMLSNRGAIDGVTIRLPGVLARPKGPSGMKSAFMSNLFHALRAGERFLCPVSGAGTIWAQSLDRVVDNFVHALSMNTGRMPPTRAVTLPAVRCTMGALAQEVARQCGRKPDLVSYDPDPVLQAGFAAQPPLITPAAERAGFAHDGNLAKLVESALRTLS